MEYGEAVNSFEEFFSEEFYRKVAQAVQNGDESVKIDFQELDRFDPELTEYLVDNPSKALGTAEEGVKGVDIVSGEEIKPRFFNMPEEDFVKIKNLRSEHIGKFIPLNGMIKRASQVKPEVFSAVFECSQCGDLYEKEQDSSQLKSPYKCDCGSRKFEVDEKKMIDTQNIVMEENPDSREGSEQPATISVRLKGDLVDPDFQKKVVPGNVANITGIIRETPFKKNSKKFDMYMEANHLEPTEQEFEELVLEEEEIEEVKEMGQDPEIFDRIANSIAPSIYGHHQIKKAIALQLFRGVKKTREDGVKSRGDIHILLIGEPGTGKSQILKFTGQISPKGRYVVGKSATGAGMCVTGKTMILTSSGLKKIGEMARKEIPEKPEIETCKKYRESVYSFGEGEIKKHDTRNIWRMPEKECTRIKTEYGKELEVSKNTQLLTVTREGIEWKKITEIGENDYIAAPDYSKVERNTPHPYDFFEFDKEKFKLSEESREEIFEFVEEKYGSRREAASELEIDENFFYDTLKNRHIPKDRLEKLLDGIGFDLKELEIESLMLRNGNKFEIPERFSKDLMYLIGMTIGDGDIHIEEDRAQVRISNSNRRVLEKCRDIVENEFGKDVKIEKQKDRVPVVRISLKTIAKFFRNLGMESPKKEISLDPEITNSKNIDHFLKGLMDADGSVIKRKSGSDSIQISTISEDLARQVQLILETYGIKSKLRERDTRKTHEKDGLKVRTKNIQYNVTIRGSDIDRFKQEIGFETREKAEKLDHISGKNRNTNKDVVPARKILSQYKASSSDNWTYFNQNKNPGKKKAQEIVQEAHFEDEGLEEVVQSSLKWERIDEKEDIGEQPVYDLSVPGTKNFIGNGLITHNTASVVRNEQTGEFELEAGAVVLANKGLASIDEIDKMSKEDRSSLHEAMEQQSISVAKANIQATLNAETSILAAGNPKFGRFDPYEPIPQQIEIGDTLLSRFDFIFPVKDEPDKSKDEKLSTQVLQNHISPEETDAEIPEEKLRKYIAYARREVKPQLTEEAADEIQEFYVNMRSGSEGEEEGNVPITARQLEALVRVAEASARAHLREEVTVEDSQRAIDILTYCLKEVGVDPETGDYDIDMIESGVSSSQRNRLQSVKQIIRSLGGEDDAVEIEKVVESAEDKGINREKAEEIIERLRREGELWEPQSGHIQQV